jgi:hypothetical protein
MKTRLELTLVFLLSLVCMPAHAGESKDCGLKQLASLDLAQISGRVLVPVTVRGKSVWLALHTGSAFSLIFDEDARELQLHRKKLSLPPGVSVGQKGEVSEVAIVDDLQIGRIHYPDVSFPLVSRQAYHSPTQSFDQRPIIGALGMDVLGTVDFELDIAHSKLNLFSQDHCPGRVVYWGGTAASLPLKRGDFGELYFPIKLDGKTLEAVIFPASKNSALRSDVAQKIYGFDEHSADNKTTTEADGKTITYRLMNVATPAFEVRNALVELHAQADKYCVVAHHGSDGAGYDGCRGSHPLLLGISVLNKLRIYCATKERMLYLSPADTAATEVPKGTDTQ